MNVKGKQLVWRQEQHLFESSRPMGRGQSNNISGVSEMDVVRNFKSLTVVQFCGLQIFEFVYVAALAFLPFFLASQEFVYAILFIFAVAVFIALFKRHTSQVVNPVGKTVLITSCDSGLGNACARRFVSRGFTVIAGCQDITSDSVSALKEADTHKLHIVKLDIKNEENVQQAMLQINSLCRDKGLWALVNNIGGEEFLLDTDTTKMNAYRTGALRITKACLPIIKTAKGRVIMITGSLNKVTVPGQSDIYTSNYGLEALSDSLKLELQPFGIKVIAIKPTNLSGTVGIFNLLQLLHLTKSTSSSDNMMDAIEEAVRRQSSRSQVLVDAGS